jgi:hypothetical protein
LKQFTTFQEQQAALQKMGLKMAKEMFGKTSNAPPADAP